MIPLVFTLVIATQLVNGEWRQANLTYVSMGVTTTVVHVQNPGPSTITVTGQSGDDGPRHKWIVGASLESPPTWDSRFTPLQQNTATQHWSFNNWSLPAHYEFFCDSLWVNSYGNQQFEWYEEGSASGTMLRRDRDWWEPNGTAIYQRQYIFGGGNGGGN